MKPVFQSVNKAVEDIVPGDCLRASVATLFNLNLLQVPHFLLFDKSDEGAWWNMFWWFFRAFEWDVQCYEYVTKDKLTSIQDIDGHYMASVPSTFPNADHSVVIDANGTIVHDPSPMEFYKGKNIYDIEDQSSVEVLVIVKANDNIKIISEEG